MGAFDEYNEASIFNYPNTWTSKRSFPDVVKQQSGEIVAYTATDDSSIIVGGTIDIINSKAQRLKQTTTLGITNYSGLEVTTSTRITLPNNNYDSSRRKCLLAIPLVWHEYLMIEGVVQNVAHAGYTYMLCCKTTPPVISGEYVQNDTSRTFKNDGYTDENTENNVFSFNEGYSSSRTTLTAFLNDTFSEYSEYRKASDKNNNYFENTLIRKAQSFDAEMTTRCANDNIDYNIYGNTLINTIVMGIPGQLYLTANTTIQSVLPIYTLNNIDGFYKWYKTGNTDDQNNGDDKGWSIDYSTDWTVYIDGKAPDIKLTWKSQKIEEWINSDQNTDKWTLDDFMVEVGHNTPTGEYELLKFFPYTEKSYSTTYAILAKQQDPDAWDKFLAEILGSLTGIGDVYLFFRVYTRKKKSASCYVAVPYSAKPTLYGQWRSMLGDTSTVTIVYNQGIPSDKPDDDYPPEEDDGDLDDEDIDTDTGDESGGGLSTLTTTYELSDAQLKSLGAFVWSKSFFDDILRSNENPIENIISLKMIPVTPESATSKRVVIGNVDTGVSGLLQTKHKIVDLGTVTLPKKYNNFLDYPPYTKTTIYLPYIGFKEIDATLLMGKTVKLVYIVDIVTGSCKAKIYTGNKYLFSFEGQIGYDIAITSSNRASVESGILSSAIGTIASFSGGDVAGGTINLLHTAQQGYHYSSNGRPSPICDKMDTQQPYVIIERAIGQYPNSFGHDYGFPCLLTRRLGNLRGFTKISHDVDLTSIACTAPERNQIHSLLTSGVYI